MLRASLCSLVPLTLPAVGAATQFDVVPSDPQQVALLVEQLASNTEALTFRLMEWPADAAALTADYLEEVHALGRERDLLLDQAIRADPAAAQRLLLTAGHQQVVERLAPGSTSQPAELEGELTILVGDRFDEAGRIVHTATSTVLEPHGLHVHSAAGHDWLSGDRVSLTGWVHGDRFLHRSPSGYQAPQTPPPLNLVGDYKVLIVDARYSDDPVGNGISASDTFTPNGPLGQNCIQDFYEELSYQQSPMFDVTLHPGELVVTIPNPNPEGLPTHEHYCQGIGSGEFSVLSVLDAALPDLEAQHDLTTFDGIAFQINWTTISEGGTCPYSGIASLGKRTVTLGSGATHSLSVMFLGEAYTQNKLNWHEFGHNLGSRHAQRWECYGQPISAPGCEVKGYGDKLSVMADNVGHMNAIHKEVLGWLGAPDILAVQAFGTYTIEPMAKLANWQHPKALKISRGGADYLYVEYRTPINADYDAFQYSSTNAASGASLYIPIPGAPKESGLVHADLGNTNWNQFALVPGLTFHDPVARVDYSVANVSANSIDVTIAPAGCADIDLPTITIDSPAPGATVSGNVAMQLTASDPTSDLAAIQLFIDGSETPYKTKFPSAPTSNWTTGLLWDTTQFSNGTHTLRARTLDDPSGASCPSHSSWSSEVTVTVQNYGNGGGGSTSP